MLQKKVDVFFNRSVVAATKSLGEAVDNNLYHTEVGRNGIKDFKHYCWWISQNRPERRAEFALRVMKGVWK